MAPAGRRGRLVALVVAGLSATRADDDGWRRAGRDAFVGFLEALGCEQCAPLRDGAALSEVPFTLSSQVFGCADVDVLLPSLHWLYEAARRRLGGEPPGLLVDGGANVGRATARWLAAMGDTFGRATARNRSQAPCIICAGAEATEGRGAEGAASDPPGVAVVAVEPSPHNFALLQKHADESGWEHEGFLALRAALGSEPGEAPLAFTQEFAIDETATLLFEPQDQRPTQPVRVITLEEVLRAAGEAFPDMGAAATSSIFLLKLDIEGMEPAVLRSLSRLQVPAKFVSFEYAANVWQERLGPVVAGLHASGYFCFLVTNERLFPISGPFWDAVYELPMWSNVLCGQEGDADLDALLQLHSGAVGLWPMI
ncbi:unnamed protein product, partial [Prorocentrum cordatum]